MTVWLDLYLAGGFYFLGYGMCALEDIDDDRAHGLAYIATMLTIFWAWPLVLVCYLGAKWQGTGRRQGGPFS